MIKKLLFPGIATILGLVITSGLYLPTDKTYEKRNAESHKAEPNAMRWAQIDLRTGEFNPYARIEAKEQLAHHVNRGSLNLTWLNRGPDNVGGRTRAIIEIFNKPDTLIAGSVSGGLFVSYNGGGNWSPHIQFDNLDSNSSIVASIHQDTLTGNIYVGTGSSCDAYGNICSLKWPGYGMFVSTDNGVTFSHVTSTTPGDRFSTGGEWVAINRITTDLAGNIYAATELGLRMSTDGGATWSNPVFIDPNQTIPLNGTCTDVASLKNGTVIASYETGAVYLAEAGGDFEQVNDRGLASGARRTVLATHLNNTNIFYVMFINGADGCLNAIYKTTNGGASFFKLIERFNEFTPMQGGSSCQGPYDAAMGVLGTDPNTIFIGGVELWRFDGSLTRVATEGGGSPPFSDVSENYVHADKHLFYTSPNNPGRVYVTSDGGIAKTEDRGNTWSGLNKGYVTTQFYGITHFNGGGTIVGGTQDNGTLAVLGANSNDPNIGYQVFGNDGIDCDASQNMPIIFASSQNGLVTRVDVSAATAGNIQSQPPFAFFSGMGSGGPFNTVVKLWESKNDETSQDSIEFVVEPVEFAVAAGNGILRNFNESFTPVQKAAIVIESSVVVKSSGMELTVDPENPGELIGDGEGTVTFNNDRSIDISVTFASAPSENANILVSYEERFDANSVLELESKNLRSLQGSYVFEHRLENALNPGDAIKVQDPVQSFLLSTGAGPSGGIRLYRNVLNAQELPPSPIDLSSAGVSGIVTCAEVTNDGDVAFIGVESGGVLRVSGLRNLYTSNDLDNVDVASLFNIGGPVTGIALDRTDNNRVVVTGGGYGASNRVRFSDNALASTTSWTNVHGDMPPFPVYDAEFNVNDPNMVFLGTEFGVWATGDITQGAGTSWSEENHKAMFVPTYDIRQQWLPFSEASNSGVIYVGSHGAGLWESADLVGVPEVAPLAARDNYISDMKIFPNPIQNEGMISFESGFTGQVNVRLYDFNGRQMSQWQERVSAGQNNLQFATHTMRTGTYFAVIDGEGFKESAKFIVMH